MEKSIGMVTHYYGKLGVAIVKLSGDLKLGEKIRIIGRTTDFSEDNSSMQLDHRAIKSARKGDEVGIKVGQEVREGDEVFKIL
jgi:putative protease